MQTPRFISTATVSGIANRRRRGNGSDMAVDTRFRYGGGYTGPIWGWTHGADMGVDTRFRYGVGHTGPMWGRIRRVAVGADTRFRYGGGHTGPMWGRIHGADVGADTQDRRRGGHTGPPLRPVQPVARRPFAGIHAPRSRSLLPTVTLERSEESHVASMGPPFQPVRQTPL